MTPPDSSATPSAGRTLLLGAVLIAAIALALLAMLSLSRQAAVQPTPTYAPTNTPNVGAGETITLLNPGRPLNDFKLPASTGGDLSLSDFAGQTVLLYFGYTHCPDFCPTTLSQFAAVRTLLGAEGETVQAVMVSVDPARDTPEALREYVTQFDPTFIGLQGVEPELNAISGEYGLTYGQSVSGEHEGMAGMEAASTAEAEDGYLVDHTVSSYLIDSSGRLRAVFSYGTPTRDMVETVRAVLTETEVTPAA